MAKKGVDPKTKAANRARKEMTTAANKKRRQARHQKALDKKRAKMMRRAEIGRCTTADQRFALTSDFAVPV